MGATRHKSRAHSSTRNTRAKCPEPRGEHLPRCSAAGRPHRNTSSNRNTKPGHGRNRSSVRQRSARTRRQAWARRLRTTLLLLAAITAAIALCTAVLQLVAAVLAFLHRLGRCCSIMVKRGAIRGNSPVTSDSVPAMGTVRRLTPAAGDVTLGQATEAYLGTLGGAEQASTRRTYGRILRQVVAEFGAETAPDEVDAERFAAWFGSQWADRAPSTWNVSLDAVRSAAAYWQRQGWLTADFSRMLARRKPRPDRGRALTRGRGRPAAHPQRHQPARADALADAVRDRRQVGRSARARRRGPRPAEPARPGPPQGRCHRRHRLADRHRAPAPAPAPGPTAGPVFVTERKARVQLPAADLDERGRARLSYQQAEALFAKASGGATLHQLRHSALTHDARPEPGHRCS